MVTQLAPSTLTRFHTEIIQFVVPLSIQFLLSWTIHLEETGIIQFVVPLSIQFLLSYTIHLKKAKRNQSKEYLIYALP